MRGDGTLTRKLAVTVLTGYGLPVAEAYRVLRKAREWGSQTVSIGQLVTVTVTHRDGRYSIF